MTAAAAGVSGRRRQSSTALVVLPLAISTLVNFAITRNYFYADDFLNFFQIANDDLTRYLLTPNGGHALVTRNGIWYLLAQIFGVQPSWYFWSALLTHLLNVALLFGVIQRFTRSALLAAFGAAMWGASPFNEGTLGSYSVYGQEVVGTALLIVLYQAALAADAGLPRSRVRLWLWYGLALAAATSFGVGIALAMVLPFVVTLLLPQWRRGVRLPLLSLVVVTPVLYEVLLRLYNLIAGQQYSAGRFVNHFVLEHPWPVIWSTIQLPAYGVTRLLSGFWYPEWMSPAGWDVVLGVFIIAAALAFRSGSPQTRRQLAAAALVVVAAYGIVAAGRGMALYRAPLDWMIAVTRYHYVALIGLAIILCLILNELGRRYARIAAAGTWWLAAWSALTLTGYAIAAPEIEHWNDSRAETARTLESIRAAIEAAPPGGPVYIRNRPFPPMPPVFVPFANFPGWAAVFVVFYPDQQVDGRTVYFIESDADTREAAQRGHRTRDLLVPPPG